MADDTSGGTFWDEVPPDVYTGPDIVWQPGNNTTTVPTSDPSWNGDPFAVLKQVGGIAAAGVSAASSFLNTRDSLNFARQDRALNQQRTQAQIDFAKQQLNSQSQIDNARIAAQTEIAKRQFANMPALTSLFGGTSAPAGTDWLMLVLTAVGVYYAWRAVGKHA